MSWKARFARWAQITIFVALAACGQTVPSGSVDDLDIQFADLNGKPFDSLGMDGLLPDLAAPDAAPADAADVKPDDVALDPDGQTAGSDADDATTQNCEFSPQPSPGEPGHACNGAADCESGYCLEGPTGKICSKACVDCCPTGFQCEQFGGAGDLTFVCAPKWAALCRPCDTDAACLASGKDALCVSYGDSGSFCAAACVTNADCPGDYVCQSATGEKGTAKQCVRVAGECGCSATATAAGAQTTCHKQNAAGMCNGVRKCTAAGLTACPAAVPATETCGNGIDDDCNGATDENKAQGCVTYFPDGDGDGDGLSGSTGVCQCASTTLYHAVTATDCNDVDAKVNQWAVEVCDGADNNCNGKTDEGCDDDGDGYCDGSLLYFPAPICPKGGNDCDDANAGVHANVPETCGNGVDENCDGLTDAGNDVAGCVAFYLDGDGDGYGSGAAACLCSAKGLYTAQKNGDCNDASESIHPGQPDICGNGKDDDCSGLTDEAGSAGCSLFFTDVDGDGFGVGTAVCMCAADAQHSASKAGDCDDAKVAIHPGTKEACNGADDNCDGTTDEADASGCKLFYADLDGDSFGDPATGLCLCGGNAISSATDASDCDDTAATIHPGAVETCNGLDDDCDALTDEDNTQDCTFYYADADGDGFGNAANAACLCAPAGGYQVAVVGDCDDKHANIHPGATEVCDGVDNNCKDGTDEIGSGGCTSYYRDEDADGYGQTTDIQCLCAGTGAYLAVVGGDCNDAAAAVHPKGLEACNGVDDDCDGLTDPVGSEDCKLWFVDADNDGYGTYFLPSKCLCAGLDGYANAGGDCADADAAIHPKATEVCNGLDDNCDGTIDPKDASGCVPYYYDGDADGYGLTAISECACSSDGPFAAKVSGDCNDGSAGVNPGASETCNTVDDNCNAQTDEQLPTTTWYLDGDKDGYGTGNGVTSCGTVNGLTASLNGDCNDTSSAIHPGLTETCGNGVDDTCSGVTDENCNTCTGGKGVMNGVCVDLGAAAINAGGREVVTSSTVSLYVLPPGNLLTNGGAEANDFSGWTKPSVYDDWSITSTDYGLPVPFGSRVFRPSYLTSNLAQTVDLVGASVPVSGLNANTPLQYGAFGMGWGCKDTLVECGPGGGTSYADDSFGLDVTFQDASGTQLTQWASQTYYLTLGVWAAPFQNNISYPSGTRKVVVQVHGDDGESWGGYYGPSIDGAFLIYGKLDMRFSNDGVTWSSWQSYQPLVTGWSLTPGAGVKTVRVEFRDGAGVSLGTTSDSVTLQ